MRCTCSTIWNRRLTSTHSSSSPPPFSPPYTCRKHTLHYYNNILSNKRHTHTNFNNNNLFPTSIFTASSQPSTSDNQPHNHPSSRHPTSSIDRDSSYKKSTLLHRSREHGLVFMRGTYTQTPLNPPPSRPFSSSWASLYGPHFMALTNCAYRVVVMSSQRRSWTLM